MATEDFATNQVQLKPADVLLLNPGTPVVLEMVNNSPHRLTFKLRTTKIELVKPTTGYGMLEGNGGRCFVHVKYTKQAQGGKALRSGDRLTVYVMKMSDDEMNPQHFWQKNKGIETRAKRYVLKLREVGADGQGQKAKSQPGKQKMPKKKTEAELTEDEEDEEDEEEEDEEEEEEEEEEEAEGNKKD